MLVLNSGECPLLYLGGKAGWVELVKGEEMNQKLVIANVCIFCLYLLHYARVVCVPGFEIFFNLFF